MPLETAASTTIPRTTRPPRTTRERLFDIGLIYIEKDALEYPRTDQILGAFPDAEQVLVEAHHNIAGLYGNEGLVRDWIKVKRSTLVLGVKKSLFARPNTRSSDFIAPSHSNGCGSACTYCVAEGTLILTPTGPRPVQQIQDGDEVLAFDSSGGRLVPAAVCGTAAREADEVLEIEIGDTKLRVTAEHPILTRRGWVQAGHLTEDDEVLCDDGHIT